MIVIKLIMKFSNMEMFSICIKDKNENYFKEVIIRSRYATQWL